MITNLKYEFYKLFSVRSTYFASVLALTFSCLAIVAHVVGYSGLPGDLQTTSVASAMLDTPIAPAIIGGVVAILFMVHEYRYNTITYTLAASRSRLTVLFAKFITILCYATVMGVLCVGLGVACYYIGMNLRGADVPAQTFDVAATLAKSVGYCVGMALLGLMFAVMTRTIVFAVVALFMLPTVEPLLGVFLKDNVIISYLPFTALTHLILPEDAPDSHIAPLTGALVFSVYLIVGWVVAALLFLRRDATS